MAVRVLDERVPADDTVLITGPPMTGKYRLFVSLLSRRCEQFALISTHARAERIRSDFADTPSSPSSDRIGVIDCVRHPNDGPVLDDDLVRRVGSPRNLTDIGVQFTEVADELPASSGEARTGVGLYSVSQLLMFSSVETVFRFLKVLTDQVTSRGWFGLAILDGTTDADEERASLERVFETVVETRERDDGTREFRVRTSSSEPTGWTPLAN